MVALHTSFDWNQQVGYWWYNEGTRFWVYRDQVLVYQCQENSQIDDGSESALLTRQDWLIEDPWYWHCGAV